MNNLPKRLQYIACSSGRHKFKEKDSIGYESWSEYTLVCSKCGETVKDFYNKGVKTGRRIVREGKYRK